MGYLLIYLYYFVVVSEGGHLCITIDCKIRTTFQKAIFYTDVTIIMFPTYPKDEPHVYLRKKPSIYYHSYFTIEYVVNLKCPYIRDKCVVKYNTRKSIAYDLKEYNVDVKWTLKEAILECERLFATCCPVFISFSFSILLMSRSSLQETAETTEEPDSQNTVSTIQFEELVIEKFIGSGAFGNVYKG